MRRDIVLSVVASVLVISGGIYGAVQWRMHHPGIVLTAKTANIAVSPTKGRNQPLADGMLQPADPKLVGKLTSANVEDAIGHSESLTADKPTMFFAYWCGHCHEAIAQLESTGYASKFDFVSSQLQYGQGNANPNIKQAAQATKDSFNKLHIKEPENMFFAMPGTPMSNALTQQPVPFLLLHTKQGWFTMTGAPNNKDVWLEVLGYATN